MNLFGIGAGVLAMVGWGASDFFAAKTSRKIGSFRALFWMSLITAISLLIFYLFLSHSNKVSSSFFLFLSLVGLLQDIGALCFYKSLAIGKVSLVSPIAGSWAVWTVILSIIILKEKPTFIQLVGIFFIIMGVFFISTKIKELLKEMKFVFFDTGVKLAFLSSLMWGSSYVIYKPIIDKIGWLLSLTILYCFIVFWLFLYSLLAKKKISFKPNKLTISLIFLISLTNIIVWFAYSFGLEKNLASIISPIASTFPLVTVFLARIFLKEKLVWNQILGIAEVILGLVFLSL